MRHKTFRFCAVLLCSIVFVYVIWFHKEKDSNFSSQPVYEDVNIFKYDDIFEDLSSSNSLTASFNIISFYHVDKNDRIDLTYSIKKQHERSQENFKIETLNDVFDFLYKSNSFLLDINYISLFSVTATQSLSIERARSKFQKLLEENEDTKANKLKLVTFGINSKFFFTFNQVLKLFINVFISKSIFSVFVLF